jgi:cobalt-zinc-cadmium efflux system outer membrane protein
MKRRLYTTIGVMWALSIFQGPKVMVSAQETREVVTLEEALSLFGQNSPGLHLARSRLRAALGGIRQDRALPNPQMAITHEALGDYSESYLNLTQQMDFLWERGNRGERAEALRSRAQAEFLADSVLLVSEVRRAYIDAWQRRETVAAYGRSDEVMGELLASAEARFSEGDLAGYDLRRLRFETLQFGRRTALAELDLEEAERRLGSFLVDSDGSQRISVEDLVITEIGERLEGDLLARALASRPEIRSAESFVDALEASAGLARSSVLRGTSVTGGLKRQADGQEGGFLALAFPLPFADRRKGAVDAAQAEVLAAESEVELLRRSIAQQVSLASARLQIAQRQQELLGPTGVEEAQELLAIARLSFAEGEMRAVDVLDATRAFVEAQLMESQVQGDLWEAYFELEQAVGGFSNETDNGVRER